MRNVDPRFDKIDKALKEQGLSANDMNTNAYAKVRQILYDNPDVGFAGLPEEVDEAIRDAAKIVDYMRTITTNANLSMISDRKTVDALMAYRYTLKNTLEIFGEERITEAVMLKAIEAASYIGYRTIMGEAAPIGGGRYK